MPLKCQALAGIGNSALNKTHMDPLDLFGLLEFVEIPGLDGEAPMVSCLGLQKNWEKECCKSVAQGRSIHRC